MPHKKQLLFLPVLLLCAVLVLPARGVREVEEPEATELPLKVFVSILPQRYFVQQIGGERLEVEVMVPPGSSPATYEPTPQQMVALSDAALFFTIGVPFEQAFIPTVKSNLPDLSLVATDEGFDKRSMTKEPGGRRDPHIWMDPVLVQHQIKIIRDSLIEIDPEGAEIYASGYKTFKAELESLDRELEEALAPVVGGKLFVYHPAFGYFLDRYGIEQIAIETGGKEPSPAQLEEVIGKVQEAEARVIFVQPEFSRRSAEAVARAINGAVVEVAPLAPNYPENLRSIARQIREGLSR
jgi:zinc transport system substrate-binding protein